MAARRILLAGLVGGVVLFAWGAFSHMVLPIGEVGIKTLPNEAAVMQALSSTIVEHGFYFFPGLDMSHDVSEAEQAAWTDKYKAGPIGVLVYQPQGKNPMSPAMFGTELLSNILAALIAALIVSATHASFRMKVAFVALMGLFAWFSLSWSYWNWYAFPTDFILVEGLDEVIGWVIAGLAIVWILGRGVKAIPRPQAATFEALSSRR